MDKNTASLLIRMHIALNDEGIGPHGQRPEDPYTDEDQALIVEAFRVAQQPPAVLSDYVASDIPAWLADALAREEPGA